MPPSFVILVIAVVPYNLAALAWMLDQLVQAAILVQYTGLLIQRVQLFM